MATPLSDRAKLVAIHAAAKKTREKLEELRNGSATLDQIAESLIDLDAALAQTDPNAPREATELGRRILDAAHAAGFDQVKLERALGEACPSGALTRLLYHPTKTIRSEHLQAIADATRSSLGWLMEGLGEMPATTWPEGAIAARRLGVSEEAIGAILSRPGGAPTTLEEWSEAMLGGPPPAAESTTRLK